MNGIGAHEVIIECPFHEVTLANLSEDNIREVLWVYRDRMVDLKKRPTIELRPVVQECRRRRRLFPAGLLWSIPLATDCDSHRSHFGVGGNDRSLGIFQLSRALYFLRHDPQNWIRKARGSWISPEFYQLALLTPAGCPFETWFFARIK